MEKFKFLDKNKISRLPKGPGIYCFKKGREFLYIGKAANLRERVKNHFWQPTYRDGLFANQISKIGYLKAGSEIEALVLEVNLIKKHQPKYNVVWRDDKNYFYVGITKEDFPQVFITHQPKLKIEHVGPFVDGKALKQTLKVLRKVFPYRTCKTLPKHPCLWYQLNRCPAPCLLKSNLGKQLDGNQVFISYQRNIKNLLKILQGKKPQVLRNLKKEMEKASTSQDYERAAKIRDQIIALEKVLSHAKIFESIEVSPRLIEGWQYRRIEAYDVSNIQGQQATGSMVVFINGKSDKSRYRKFKIKTQGKPNDVAMLKEILKRRSKHKEWPLPDLVLIDGGKPQLNAARGIVKKKIPVIALAKKKNELFIEDRRKPILLKSFPREIFNLILQLRDEAHRFAISYHKKLRKKALLKN